MLTQFVDQLPKPEQRDYLWQPAIKSIADLKSMRFLDLSPDAMRRPSIPGQTTLGDRGENLSSVLQAMCETAATHRALAEWIKQLTPMDVVDFDFVSDASGKIAVTLIEADGQRTSASSASDGTLRFLGMLAVLLGPRKEKLIFMEEIETGLHPTRLHLLVELLEHSAAAEHLQVVGTTHSPQMLRHAKLQRAGKRASRLPRKPTGTVEFGESSTSQRLNAWSKRET